MKQLNIVFFGTPEFARSVLEAVHHSHHQVVGVVTVADKASGRGQKITQSPVKIYAEEQGLPVFQPDKLRDPEFLDAMRKLEADIFVVVAFRMMPQVLFNLPPMGTFNLHASLLPDYRGAAPINFALINGEKQTGVTTFFINEKIDEGHLLLQKTTAISPEDNAGTLHDKLMAIGAQLVVETLNALAENRIEPTPQPVVENPKNAFKIFKEDTLINWEQNSEVVHNFIRGMSPYPCAFTVMEIDGEEKSLKLFSGRFQLTEHNHPCGSVDISKTHFRIYTQDGFYEPLELQLQGKKKMPLKDFLNGFRNFDHIRLKK
ncbi:methionyl-tRNA formyltransferase [Bergeyella sp. RCAD1439]|uniref:methionyl-tRNA formyltransferase n=1 Tax=Bergeyella anatis TaxID=3113737 RepID=UPI002E1850E8|nr:methionyl-tRNA formyltransferase [Bergeyella sp. RCAD1439]